MPYYETLSKTLTERIIQDKSAGTYPKVGFDETAALRRNANPHDAPSVWRTAFIRDAEKIIHCPFYNRYTDKTQVFSFYKNDDITRRALHVQLVSRVARTIGSALNLNCNLIEAIALGHDIGHTPFGHVGEKFLDELYYANAGKHFLHNVHSVRVLDKIFPLNLCLQTLSGIVAHDGESERPEYAFATIDGFDEFDDMIANCYADKSFSKKILPNTLEGCVVKISDIIAYVGKDRQDAVRAGIVSDSDKFGQSEIGTTNSEIINNLVVNIIENSYGKNTISLDDEHFAALKRLKEENYRIIYLNGAVTEKINRTVKPMMAKMYETLLSDIQNGKTSSPAFTHHINDLNKPYFKRPKPYRYENPNDTVVDYIASMTDDYFNDLYRYLFPRDNLRIDYVDYFEDKR